ncbi:MAG: HAD-IIIA family hydrolase [Deltaproteobacteria bacterium]|nr:HAD-IIIA family hydrolase [Deltaproteobacteria bacterium]
MKIIPEIADKLKRIKLLILDVDGVLTDGSIIYNNDFVETKIFNVKDGLGIRLLMRAGIDVCIATGRSSEALYHRCKDLNIIHIFDALSDKTAVLKMIVDKLDVSVEEIAFIGDDLPDIPLMKLIGLPITVADAAEEVKKIANTVTEAKGGAGAVREVCEAILKAGELWDETLHHYL